MKLPAKIIRAFVLLPEDFKGTIVLSTNGRGLWSYEVHHKETVQGEHLRELVDLQELLTQKES